MKAYSFLKRHYGILIGIGFVIVWMVIFIFVSVFWTWGEIFYCAAEYQQCFCEKIDTSRMVAEPINAWSNFFYVGAGLIVLMYYDLQRNKKSTRKEDYLSRKENLHYLLTYGLSVIWIGIASFLMHATWRGDTGYLDLLSMNMYISLIFFISLSVLFDLNPTSFYPILVGNFIFNGVLMRFLNAELIFVSWVLIAFLNEFAVGSGLYSKIFKKRARQIRRNLLVLIGAVGVFLLAYYLWHFGYRGHPLCDPYSWWQWHALWHFMTAVTTILLVIYLKTEKTSSTREGQIEVSPP
ncbi:MAG: ceramidase domain-containing protein [Promethearchaeia archaeon]